MIFIFIPSQIAPGFNILCTSLIISSFPDLRSDVEWRWDSMSQAHRLDQASIYFEKQLKKCLTWIYDISIYTHILIDMCQTGRANQDLKLYNHLGHLQVHLQCEIDEAIFPKTVGQRPCMLKSLRCMNICTWKCKCRDPPCLI